MDAHIFSSPTCGARGVWLLVSCIFESLLYLTGDRGVGEDSLKNRILLPAKMVCDGNTDIPLGKVEIDTPPLETTPAALPKTLLLP